MGYGVYEDRAARDYGVVRWAGYMVPGICDLPGCSTEIDRGMGYRCSEQQLEGKKSCELHFCTKHLYDHKAHKDSVPKPDLPEWLRWMLTDESWAEWRTEEPEAAAAAWDALGPIDKLRVLVGRLGISRRVLTARYRLDDWRLSRTNGRGGRR